MYECCENPSYCRSQREWSIPKENSPEYKIPNTVVGIYYQTKEGYSYIYTGEINDARLPDGKGELKYIDGPYINITYKGSFKNGERHGHGFMIPDETYQNTPGFLITTTRRDPRNPKTLIKTNHLIRLDGIYFDDKIVNGEGIVVVPYGYYIGKIIDGNFYRGKYVLESDISTYGRTIGGTFYHNNGQKYVYLGDPTLKTSVPTLHSFKSDSMKLNVAELKTQLKQKGLDQTGDKEILAERLAVSLHAAALAAAD